MQLKPQITIRDVPHSKAIEDNIRKKIEKLNQFYGQIMHCDVTIEQAQKNKHRGKLYKTRVSLTVPGEELTVNRAVNEDVYVATRDAFRAITRKLQSFSAKRHQAVKQHPIPIHGQVTRIFPEEGYGFIRSGDSEYYFAFSNVAHPDFDSLDIGSKVQFTEIVGDDGLQAQHVCVGKHKGLQEE